MLEKLRWSKAISVSIVIVSAGRIRTGKRSSPVWDASRVPPRRRTEIIGLGLCGLLDQLDQLTRLSC